MELTQFERELIMYDVRPIGGGAPEIEEPPVIEDPPVEPSVEEPPIEEPPAEPPVEENIIEKDGVKYTLDDEGNHCIGTVKVLDDKGVPFYNRSREYERKTTETQQQFDQRITDLKAGHQAEIERLSAPADDIDPLTLEPKIDPATGLPEKAVRVITQRITQTFETKAQEREQQREIQRLNDRADLNIGNERSRLETNPKYKEFFGNPTYVAELEEGIRGLFLDDAVKPGVVKKVIGRVLGGHIEEVRAAAEARGRKSEREQREIIGEVELGKSAGVAAGTKVVITDEIRAQQKAAPNLTLAECAEVIAAKHKAEGK